MDSSVITLRKSSLPLRLRPHTFMESSCIPIVSRHAAAVTPPMPSTMKNDTISSKSSFVVGDRVLINGLKNGTLRYVGTVKFAQGIFCGVELDEPDGKHDGQVNNIRYFQCKKNYGIFVPYDKVILAPRSTPQALSRLKAPVPTRTMTLPSSPSKITDKHQLKSSQTSMHLPDIIPNSSTSVQSTEMIEAVHESTTIANQDNNKSTAELKSTVQSQSSTTNDDQLETVETDFTDSVSLVLHRLQEQQPLFNHLLSSTTVSEDGTVDEDEDEDEDTDEGTDELNTPSSAKPATNERILSNQCLSSTNDLTKSVQTDLSFDISDNITFIKNSLLSSKPLSDSTKSLASSTRSNNKLGLNNQDNKGIGNMKRPTIPTPIPNVKKVLEKKPSLPVTKSSESPRKSTIIPLKTGFSPLAKTNSTTLVRSQSKISQSSSLSNSVHSSQSDLTFNQQNSANNIPKSIVDFNYSANANSDKKLDDARRRLEISESQLKLQRLACQSFEITNERLRRQCQQLLNRFDLMQILCQYQMTEHQDFKEQYELKLSKIRTTNKQLKNKIEQLHKVHQDELILLKKQYDYQMDIIDKTNKEKLLGLQQQIDTLTKERLKLEANSSSLQEQVDRFMAEMANSENADPLLRRVEMLEKDKASLQTVLEIRNQELTQLRTRINEQVIQREDQLALQKRIDMVENRNQDLVCLLRNWQLNEKAALVDRDQLKEQVAQLERDKKQLIFENETLYYRLRQRSLSMSQTPSIKVNSNSGSKQKLTRANSLTNTTSIHTNDNQHRKRSFSLGSTLNR